MLAAERRAKILESINHHGIAEVDVLAELYNVSTMTIRRDLEYLSRTGKIERCHGGAVARGEVEYATKASVNKSKKSFIAKIASQLISEGDMIYLDAGTTTFEIAIKICTMDSITVVTNDLNIATFLSNKNSNVIICGGEVQKKTGSIVGMFSNEMIERLFFDKAFIGAAAIDSEYNVLTPTFQKVALKKSVVKRSAYSYIVADSSKFDEKAFVKVNNLRDYAALITDKHFSEDELESLKLQNINILN